MAEAVRRLGFSDAAATPVGPDGGIDVRAAYALAQVKWKGGVVGRPDLQRFYGACAGEQHKATLFFSAAGYSESALEYAVVVNIALFEYDPLGEIEPLNSAAETMVHISQLGGKQSSLAKLVGAADSNSTDGDNSVESAGDDAVRRHDRAGLASELSRPSASSWVPGDMDYQRLAAEKLGLHDVAIPRAKYQLKAQRNSDPLRRRATWREILGEWRRPRDI